MEGRGQLGNNPGSVKSTGQVLVKAETGHQVNYAGAGTNHNELDRISRNCRRFLLLSGNLVNQLVTVVQILVGVAAIFASFKPGPIFYRFSTKHFPNQGLARTAFFVVGVGLTLGGAWSLWLVSHIGR